MTYRIYRDTDVGAPKLLPQRDGCNAVLLDVLVNGYGSTPSAGWTSPYSSAGLRVFQQGAGGNNRFLRVYDGQTVVNAGYGWSVNIAGYENMTAVSTGTARWPTTAQQGGNGLFFRYRTASPYDAGSGPVDIPWTIVANSNFFIMFANGYGQPEEQAGEASSSMMFFGTFVSNKTADTYGDIIGAGNNDYELGFSNGHGAFGQAFVTRNHSLTGGSIPAALYCATARPGFSTFGNGLVPYPDPITNTLILDKIHIHTSAIGDLSTSVFRGVLPCIYSHPHPKASLSSNTQFEGTGADAGRLFEIKPMSGTASVVLELSDTWV